MASPLGGFLLLYAVLYGGFGVASPFLPALVEERGISPGQIGMVFAAGTAIRLVSAPLAGRLADRFQALRLSLAACAIGTAGAVLAYGPATGFWLILAVTLLHSLALAPTTNLADALALVASKRASFEYGWVRGAGSAAFIIGSIVAGSAIASQGTGIVTWMQATLMLAMPFAAWLVPPVTVTREAAPITRAGFAALLRLPVFRNVVLVAALILGSHAMHDTFALIRWRAAGVSAQATGILWSLSVAAEVAVFFLIGPRLLAAIAPATAIAVAAVAGALRWLVAAVTADIVALVLIQPLHGITFALLHLACMRLLAEHVPPPLAATAQALYGTVGVGAFTAAMTLASGWLYASLGPSAFLAMSVLCLSALPVTFRLRGAKR